ncbi:MAG: peptide chain release factor 2 [Frankiaceae bacterium]|nr:peptide chain release factor 2 [Frankiaceae bacterium]MDX6224610.1 peptide chain release factor 2 [Frankiales bacterium]MDX6275750.1 peptide chain release factor 2 [Frankiales bacterium]
MAEDRDEQLRALDATLTSVERVVDLDVLGKELGELEARASDPDLWSDQEQAQKVTSRLSYVKAEINRVTELRRRLEDLPLLYELAEAEGDQAALEEADVELASVTKAIGELEVRTLLSGQYDVREAVVTINSGTGGTDAADWAEMLMRMFLRWAERHNYPTEVYDTSYAEEAGIKSATFVVKTPYAYGTLAGEHGRHRLVRISPFDNQSRRQTSFADVDVTPVVEHTDHIDIPDDEVRVDVYRSSGPGGQGVNTTDSAVRLTHLPTGIVVTCQNERSQIQNRARAMEVLQAKLLEVRRRQEAEEMAALRGTHQSASFGAGENKVRDYVLHPYQLVKDARTGVESGNTTAVLDGDIDQFVEAEIRWRRSQSG